MSTAAEQGGDVRTFRCAGVEPGRARRRVARCLALSLALTALLGAAPTAADELAASGEYVFAIAGCAGCHTREDGKALAGGRAFDTPFGRFYSPNITPDPRHGLGAWEEADFLASLRNGASPRGHLYPVFPYPSYTLITDEDARAMWAYLRTVEPVATPNRDHDLPWYFSIRLANRVWQWLYLDEGPYRADPDRSDAWNRGAYIARGLAHCGECHTPRGRLGALDPDRHLAGNPQGPEGEAVPNITPHPEDGIEWSVSEFRDYFSLGMMPDGDFAGGLMAEVIENGLSRLTPADLDALVEYIRSVPAARSDGD